MSTFTVDLDGGIGTYIDANDADSRHNSDGSLEVGNAGRWRTLLRYHLPATYNGETIDSAVLRMSCETVQGGGNYIDLYSSPDTLNLQANATWNRAQQGGTLWTTPGALLDISTLIAHKVDTSCNATYDFPTYGPGVSANADLTAGGTIDFLLKGSSGQYAFFGKTPQLIITAHAPPMDYSMAGPALGANVTTGMKAGLGDATTTLQTTVNNAALGEIAVMFIGLSVVIGIILYFLKGHKGTGAGSAIGSQPKGIADMEHDFNNQYAVAWMNGDLGMLKKAARTKGHEMQYSSMKLRRRMRRRAHRRAKAAGDVPLSHYDGGEFARSRGGVL